LALIGEQFDHGDEICGAVVSVRARQEKIAIWTKNASNETAQVVLLKRKEDYIYIYIYIGLFALDRKLQ
jgi:translation initiation factor 4E